MSKHFPCWVCEGKGTWVEPVLDDGSGPTEYCGFCEGKGLIEIGGKRHREITAESLALKIIRFKKPKKEDWTIDELRLLGNKALDLIE